MLDNDVKLATKMWPLRQKYLNNLATSIAEIETAITEAKQLGQFDETAVTNLREVAHKLIGSGQTYGFGAISDAGQGVEDLFAQAQPPSMEEILAKTSLLVDACKQARGTRAPAQPHESVFTVAADDKKRERPLVLSVDDDENIRDLIPQIFQSDAEVITVSNGHEALAVLEQRTPDLILLDDNMPDVGGKALLQALCERPDREKIVVVMLTANHRTSQVFDAFKLGVIDYVAKPFDPMAFRKRIMSLLDRIQRKVLVVDDDPAICEIIEIKFRALGIKVLSANNDISAFHLTHVDMPDLIILDRMLGETDGLDIFRALKKEHKTKDIPVLFLTARRREVEILEALKSGAQDYVIKPFKIDDLMVRCLRLLGLPTT